MSKGEALIQMLLIKSYQRDSRATKAVLEFSSQIGRIQTPENKIEGLRDYEFMFIPGVAASTEEWEKEIANRHVEAAFREEVKAYRARTGCLPTLAQADAYQKSLADIRADTRPGIRRPIWRSAESAERLKNAAAAPPPTSAPT